MFDSTKETLRTMKRLDLFIYIAFSTSLSALAQGPTPVGSELQVNSDADSSQYKPSLSADAAGNFVVAWTRYSYASSMDVFGQRFGSTGLPVGGEFQINAYTTGTQHEVSVAAAATGDFVVVWSSYRNYGSFDVFGRRYASDGASIGDEFQINSETTEGNRQEPAVTMADNGDFVVVWTDENTEDSSRIFGRRFVSDGTPLGPEFQVNTDTTGAQYQAAAASDPSGGFVVVWLTDSEKAFPGRVRGQRFAADGTSLGSELHISGAATEDETEPAVAMDAGGNFVVVWGEYSNIFGQRVDSAGSLSGNPFQIDPTGGDPATSPRISMSLSGDFVVVWGALTDELHAEVKGQLFDRLGSRQGGEFQVNSLSSDDQGSPALSPVRTAGDTDFFTVVWGGPAEEEATELAILGQRFNRAPSEIFADGFESADTSTWSSTVENR